MLALLLIWLKDITLLVLMNSLPPNSTNLFHWEITLVLLKLLEMLQEHCLEIKIPLID
jgi:hypothetical protein